ncbi:MAG TPA: hypothetical protein VMM13_17960, partial [Euzebya sp.]|nr:hypothetical protein [Euzebya sp.]
GWIPMIVDRTDRATERLVADHGGQVVDLYGFCRSLIRPCAGVTQGDLQRLVGAKLRRVRRGRGLSQTSVPPYLL